MALAEKSPPARAESALNRPLFATDLKIDWELAGYAALILVSIITRFWDLGARALHHDESLHALYSWYLYTGRGYQHDPMMHGPFQFHAVALTYLLFGASDYTSRVVAALFGVWCVMAPYFLRREMGRLAALLAAGFFAFSPTFMYFSRFIRNDIYMAGWAMMIVVGMFGFLRERRAGYFYLLVAGAALSFATKETVYITGFVFTAFWVLEAAVSLARKRKPVGWSAARTLSGRQWAISIAIFLGINLILYTTFFTNPRGVLSGTTGALQYWLDQQNIQRGGQPWFYYLLLIPQYEFLAIAAAAGGLLFLLARGGLVRLGIFGWFMVAWLAGTAVIYSWAGEKMPWLAVHITQPLLFLAALSTAGLLRRANWSLFARGPSLVALSFAAIIASAFLGGLVAAPALPGTQLGIQTARLQKMAAWLVILGLAVALVALGRRHGSRSVLAPAGLGLLAVLLVLTIRTGWGVTYARGDTPNEMLVYVQTSPDIPRMVQEIERISQQTGAGKDMRILLDGGYTETVGGQTVSHESIAWPFEWYLRDYRAKTYYQRTLPTPTDAPVILAMVANEDPIRGATGNYVAQRGRLNWWYPEDYKNLTWDKVAAAIGDPTTRSRVWRHFLYREPLNSLGSRDITFYVRSDLARGMAVLPSTAAAAPVAPAAAPPPMAADATLQTNPGGIAVFGKSSSGAPVLLEPRDVAIGPNGLAYVVDASAARVVAFNQDGTVAHKWGSKGSADGEFSEPWGIAVAGNGDVYVADTWNHRVQRFDGSGKFLGKWGGFVDAKGGLDVRPGSFWGPRKVAVAPDGRVLVTDAGNKRVQVFESDGRFVTMFGGEGTDPGALREPVGLAVDAAGSVYVADTWNRRIQKFDSSYRPVAQIPISDWEGQSVANKPYLAVDNQGFIYYTDPEKARFSVLSPSGNLEGSRGAAGSDPSSFNNPTGIAVSGSGEVYVADTRNGRVVRYQSWR